MNSSYLKPAYAARNSETVAVKESAAGVVAVKKKVFREVSGQLCKESNSPDLKPLGIPDSVGATDNGETGVVKEEPSAGEGTVNEEAFGESAGSKEADAQGEQTCA